MKKRGKIEQTDEDDFAHKNPSIFFYSMLLLLYIHQNNERMNTKKKSMKVPHARYVLLQVYMTYVLFIALSKKRNNTKHNITMRK